MIKNKKGIGLIGAIALSAVIIGALTYAIINVLPRLRQRQVTVQAAIDYRIFISSMSNYFLYVIKNRLLFEKPTGATNPTSCSNVDDTASLETRVANACVTSFTPDGNSSPDLQYMIEHPINFERLLFLDQTKQDICDPVTGPGRSYPICADNSGINVGLNAIEVVMRKENLDNIGPTSVLFPVITPVRDCIDAVLFTVRKPVDLAQASQNEEVNLLIDVTAQISPNCSRIREISSQSRNFFVGRQLHTMALYKNGDLDTGNMGKVNFHGPVYVGGNVILPPTTAIGDRTPKFFNKVYIGAGGRLNNSNGSPFLVGARSVTNRGGEFYSGNRMYFRGFWQGMVLENERDRGLPKLFDPDSNFTNTLLEQCVGHQNIRQNASRTKDTRLVARNFTEDGARSSLEIGITTPNEFQQSNSRRGRDGNKQEKGIDIHRNDYNSNPLPPVLATIGIEVSTSVACEGNRDCRNGARGETTSSSFDLGFKDEGIITIEDAVWNEKKARLADQHERLNSFGEGQEDGTLKEENSDPIDRGNYESTGNAGSDSLRDEFNSVINDWKDNYCNEIFYPPMECKKDEEDKCIEVDGKQEMVPNYSFDPEDLNEYQEVCGSVEGRRISLESQVGALQEEIVQKAKPEMKVSLTELETDGKVRSNQIKLEIDRSGFEMSDELSNYIGLMKDVKISIDHVFDIGEDSSGYGKSQGGPNNKDNGGNGRGDDGDGNAYISFTDPYRFNSNGNITLRNERLKSIPNNWLPAKKENSTENLSGEVPNNKFAPPVECLDLDTGSSPIAPAGWDADFSEYTRKSWILSDAVAGSSSSGVSAEIDVIDFGSQTPPSGPVGDSFDNSALSLAKRCIVPSNIPSSTLPDRDEVFGFYACDELIIRPRTRPLDLIGTFIVDKLTIEGQGLTEINFYSIWDREKAQRYKEVILKDTQICNDYNKEYRLSEVVQGINGKPIENMIEFCSPSGLATMVNNYTWYTVDPEVGYENDTILYTSRKLKKRPKSYIVVQLSRKDIVDIR